MGRSVWMALMIQICMIFTSVANPLYARKTEMKIIDLNTGRDYSKKMEARLRLFEHEVYGFEFNAYYFNNSLDTDYEISFIKHPDSDMPNYVEGWENEVLLLPAGHDTTLKRTVFIRPTAAGVDSFTIHSGQREGPDPTHPGWWEMSGRVFKVVISVRELDDQKYILPVIHVDENHFSRSLRNPKYSKGTSNQITWTPAMGDASISRILQDAYAYDINDPQNLIQSVRSLYKQAAVEDEQTTRFNGLQDSETYGFFVKAIYEEPTGSSRIFYSDFVYTIQDDQSPDRVDDAHADVTDDGNVRVWWQTVEDTGCGVSTYRIYRAEDTAQELLIDSVLALPDEPFMVWEEILPTNNIYHYRIRAVDQVGNEGDGVRTEGVSSEVTGGVDPPIDEEDPVVPNSPTDGIFLQGPVDSLWLTLKNWETDVRFIAVRDDSSLLVDPTKLGMRRFDSDWIPVDSLGVSAEKPGKHFWTFDYSKVLESDETIDLNFVDNHRYYRWMIRRSLSGFTDSTYIGSIVPDCFPPEDISTLHVISTLDTDISSNGDGSMPEWRMHLSWNPSQDRASGLKTYHVFRKVYGTDMSYIRIFPDDGTLVNPSWIDASVQTNGGVTNPYISYKITSEDRVGNSRTLDETVWEAGDRALNAPLLEFADTTSADVFQYRVDTLITKQENVQLRLVRFDISDVVDYLVTINDDPIELRNEGSDVLTISLPSDESITDFHIRLRARYVGKRSSLWSKQVVIIREANRPPSSLQAVNDAPEIGTGDIKLSWERPSLDVVDYEVWRWDESGNGELAAVIPSEGIKMEWVDAYDVDELTGEDGDRLTAFEQYTYRVRVINLFQDTTAFSEPSSAYCKKAPDLVRYAVEKRNDEDVIVVSWVRAIPTRALGSWNTHVRVSKDSLSNVVYDSADNGVHVVDDTSYIFDQDVELGHNYIFQIKEIPRPPIGRESHWSVPFTVNLAKIDSLFIQPQPGGDIYLTWEADTLVDVLPVEAFEISRVHEDNIITVRLPKNQTSYLDNGNLVHGQMYEYRVSALNVLDQVVAMNTVTAVSDTGFVFVPVADPAQYLYFNSDSITVNWHWEDIQGTILSNGTRGAVSLKLALSVSHIFPDDEVKTKTTDWFPAWEDGHAVRYLRVRVPESVDINNEIVYCRIAAKDRWDLPSPIVWSEPIQFVYDVIRPQSVEETDVVSVEAYYGESDFVIANLEWKDVSVVHSDRTLANVDYYRVVRELDGTEIESGIIPVTGSVTNYAFQDTVTNRPYTWKIVSIDSASNVTTGLSFESKRFLATPTSPIPNGFKSCQLTVLESDTGDVEYFVEIAFDPDHFRLGYEMGVLPTNRLLCQSGWITAASFTCSSGWGAVATDTTWFRVKARRGVEWESGWSAINFYTEGSGGAMGTTGRSDVVPDDFEVLPPYPNPFNASTIVPYQLPDVCHVTISVYDVRGVLTKTLIEKEQPAGAYTAIWNGTNDREVSVPSGMYFIRIVAMIENGQVYRDRLKTMLIK